MSVSLTKILRANPDLEQVPLLVRQPERIAHLLVQLMRRCIVAG